MKPFSPDLPSLHDSGPRAALRVYRALLWLYPAEFRDEYGPHMLQVFGDCHRDAADRGRAALADLWLTTLIDLVKSAFEERARKGWRMTVTTMSRLGGLAAVMGAALWTWTIVDTGRRPPGGTWGYRDVSDLIGLTFVALGLFALAVIAHAALHFSRPTRWPTLVAVLAAVVGPVMLLLALANMVSWNVALWGGAFLMASYVIVGATTLGGGALDRWSGALLLIGVVFMLGYNTEDDRVYLGLPLGLAFLVFGLTRLLGVARTRVSRAA